MTSSCFNRISLANKLKRKSFLCQIVASLVDMIFVSLSDIQKESIDTQFRNGDDVGFI